MQTEGFDFLTDTRDLWKPPRVLVRRAFSEAAVWLDEDDISFMKPTGFLEREESHILELVRVQPVLCIAAAMPFRL